MKRFLSMLIALCMVISMLPVAAFAAGNVVASGYASAEDTTRFTYKYTPTTDGTVTVTVGGEDAGYWILDVYDFSSFSATQLDEGDTEKTVSFDVEAGSEYWIRIAGPDNSGDGEPDAIVDIPYSISFESASGDAGITVEGDVLNGHSAIYKVGSDGVKTNTGEYAEELTPMAGTDVALKGGYYPESVNFQFTPETDGILTVHIIDCSTPWWFSGQELTSNKTGRGEFAMTFEVRAGTTYSFDAGGYEVDTDGFTSACTLSYEVLFYEAELEAVKEKYVFSDTVITAAGDYDVAMEENTESTIVTFTPDATGVYAITVENGTIADLKNNATLVDMFLNSEYVTALEWTCQEIAGIETDTILDENNQPIEITRETEGQSLYIGLKTEGTATITIEKIGEYVAEEVELQTYVNKTAVSSFTMPEGYVVGDYIDVTENHTAVLGEDGYYHLDSANGDILLVDMDYGTVLTDALSGGRGIMYAVITDEDGNIVEKWDVGDACTMYYRNAEEGTKYYPLTEDLMFFYDEYAASNGVYSYAGVDANAPSAWMFACLTMYDPTSGTINLGAGDSNVEWIAPLTGTVTLTADSSFVVLDSTGYPIGELVTTATFDTTAGEAFYFIETDGVACSISYQYAEGAEGGDDEEEAPTSGSFEFESYGWSNWAAPADGTVTFTVTPAAELLVYQGNNGPQVGTTAGGTITLEVSKGESYDFVDMYGAGAAMVSVAWEYVVDEGELSGTMSVAENSSEYWTAPATGTIEITVTPEDSYVWIYYNYNTLIASIFNGEGTAEVEEGKEYEFYVPYDAGDAEITWTYISNGGDEGGDEPAYNYTDLALGNNSVEAADAHWIYTATNAGTMTLNVSNSIMAAVDVSYTVNDGEAVAVANGTSVEIPLSIGDVLKVDAIGSGYCTVAAAWAAQAVEYTELTIGNNSINAEDAHWIYTAPAEGTLTLAAGGAIMGDVSISYSINGGDAQVLVLNSNAALELYTGDVVRIDVIAEGYSSLTASWEGGSGEGGETGDALVLGDNAIALAEGQINGATYTYTAAEAGTLTIEATYLEYYDAATESWNISGEDFDLALAFARSYTLTANDMSTGSNVLTVDVAAGDVVSIYFGYNNLNVPETNATLKLSMGEGSGEEGGETGSGTGSDPYIINSLPYESTYVGGTDVYYKYTAAEAVTLLITVPSDVICSGVGTDSVNNEDGTKTYTYEAAAGEVVSINPWNGSADGIFKVEAAGSQGGDEPVEPTEGSKEKPIVITELPYETDITLTDANYESGVWYQYTASSDMLIALESSANLVYELNGSETWWVSELSANDVLLINVSNTWEGAGNYTMKVYDPSVAKVGNTTYTSLDEALYAANYSDTDKTVTLLADVDAYGYVVIPVGVSIDLGEYDLTADYVYGSKESSIVANVDSGRLIVPQGNLILGNSGINAEGREVLPVWDPANENYVFSQFIANTGNADRGLFVQNEGSTLFFQWKHQATKAINQGLLGDNGSSDNDISMIIRLEWSDGDGVAYQNYVYKDAYVMQSVNNSSDYTATLRGIETLGIDMDTLVVYALIETESGAVVYGDVWTAENAK